MADLIAAPCLGISGKLITGDVLRTSVTVIPWKEGTCGLESHKDEITTHGFLLGPPTDLPPSAAFAALCGCFILPNLLFSSASWRAEVRTRKQANVAVVPYCRDGACARRLVSLV